MNVRQYNKRITSSIVSYVNYIYFLEMPKKLSDGVNTSTQIKKIETMEQKVMKYRNDLI